MPFITEFQYGFDIYPRNLRKIFNNAGTATGEKVSIRPATKDTTIITVGHFGKMEACIPDTIQAKFQVRHDKESPRGSEAFFRAIHSEVSDLLLRCVPNLREIWGITIGGDYRIPENLSSTQLDNYHVELLEAFEYLAKANQGQHAITAGSIVRAKEILAAYNECIGFDINISNLSSRMKRLAEHRAQGKMEAPYDEEARALKIASIREMEETFTTTRWMIRDIKDNPNYTTVSV